MEINAVVKMRPCPWCHETPAVKYVGRNVAVSCDNQMCPMDKVNLYVYHSSVEESVALWNEHEAGTDGCPWCQKQPTVEGTQAGWSACCGTLNCPVVSRTTAHATPAGALHDWGLRAGTIDWSKAPEWADRHMYVNGNGFWYGWTVDDWSNAYPLLDSACEPSGLKGTSGVIEFRPRTILRVKA